jgi:elongator complex protein 3
LGGRLLREAERIAREEWRAGELRILSGVGTREYYAHLGYGLEGAYMVRELSVRSTDDGMSRLVTVEA